MGFWQERGAWLSAECRRRSPYFRGKGGKRLLVEGTEVEKEGPGQGPLLRELWKQGKDKEHRHGEEWW